MALSMRLHTGLDYLMELPFDDLNEIADQVVKLTEEMTRHGKK